MHTQLGQEIFLQEDAKVIYGTKLSKMIFVKVDIVW